MALGKGDKYSPGNAMDDGLNMRESIGGTGQELRKQTGDDKGQRPVGKTETVKDDQGRGSFKSKC